MTKCVVFVCVRVRARVARGMVYCGGGGGEGGCQFGVQGGYICDPLLETCHT